MSGRKYYIDNLRWLWIVLLIPFHAAMAWNCWEGNYIWFCENKVLSSFVILISPWYMPLLFVLAGMSARYAMRNRSYGQFAMDRVKKLLIPLVAGGLTVVALMTYIADLYFNDYSESFFEHYRVFLTKITDFTGYDGNLTPAHLWFILFLFIISMVSILLISLFKKILPMLSFSKMSACYLPFLMILPLIMTPILNFGGKSIGENLALFLLGYYVLSEEDVLERVTKYRFVYLEIMIVFDIILNISFLWVKYETEWIVVISRSFAEWFGILAFLGIARCVFNQNNAFTRYMSSRSFMIYIVHFGWLVVIQYYLRNVTDSVAILYFVSVVGTIAVTLLTCELMRRIPIVSFLFGEKKKRK